MLDARLVSSVTKSNIQEYMRAESIPENSGKYADIISTKPAMAITKNSLVETERNEYIDLKIFFSTFNIKGGFTRSLFEYRGHIRKDYLVDQVQVGARDVIGHELE